MLISGFEQVVRLQVLAARAVRDALAVSGSSCISPTAPAARRASASNFDSW